MAKKYWYGKARTIEVGVSAVTGATETEVPVFAAPFNCKITKASIICKSAITGAATNYFTLGFKNKGTAGSGTDVIASKAFTSGVDASAFADTDLGAVASHGVLQKGSGVSFYKAVTGTGMNMPDLIAKLEIERM